MKKCVMLYCKNLATTTWSLKPICKKCREELREEQLKHYARKIKSYERIKYNDFVEGCKRK